MAARSATPPWIGRSRTINVEVQLAHDRQRQRVVYAAVLFLTFIVTVIAYTRAMNKELAGDGIKSVAFCPGFVDTDMSEFVKAQIPAEEMLRTSDITEALRFLLRVSPSCVVPELVFERPGEAI